MFFAFTLVSPLILPLLGNVVVRHPTGVIQEFMALSLGLVPNRPSSSLTKYLENIETK
jgi:hypothetical protein